MGAIAEHVRSIGDLEAAFKRAKAADRTYVIVIDVHAHQLDPGRRLVGRRRARGQRARGRCSKRAPRTSQGAHASASGSEPMAAKRRSASASRRSAGPTTICRSSAATSRSRTACARAAPGRLRRRREGRQVPDGPEGARPDPRASTASRWSPAGSRASCATARSRRRSRGSRSSSHLSPRSARRSSSTPRPPARCRPIDGAGRRPAAHAGTRTSSATAASSPRSPNMAEAEAARWPTTTTWARWSRPSSEIDRLMANTGPAVGLLVDTGHLTFAGGDVLATTRRHGAAHQPRPLQGHPRRRARAPQGASTGLPQGRGRGRVHRARRRLDRLSPLRQGCWPRSAKRAGSWSRPSRTRPRPTRSRWHRSAIVR